MKNLFNYDSPLFRITELIGKYILLNLLTAVCCIPIITIGACLSAHQKAMQDIVFESTAPLFKCYFQAMWSNFRQATILLFIFVISAVFLLLDLYFIYVLTEGVVATLLTIIVFLISLLITGVIACCFAFIVRYENKLSEHLRNVLYVMISSPARFLGIALLSAFPVLLGICMPNLFIQSLPIWIFIGVSCLVYLQARLICPVFVKIEADHCLDTFQ